MQTYVEQYFKKALIYFSHVQNIPKILECRIGIADLEQKKTPRLRT